MSSLCPRRDVAAVAAWQDAVARGTLPLGGATHTLRAAELDELDVEGAIARLAIPSAADPDGHLLKATVYLRDLQAHGRARAQLTALGGRAGSIELTVAPPTSGAAAAVFEWRVGGPGAALVAGRPGRVDQPGACWEFASVALQRAPDQEVAAQFHAAMTRARAGLDADLASALIRTWIYVGDINQSTGSVENYQAVNHARRVVFGELAIPHHRNGTSLPYPASTGIGTARDLLTLGLLTCRGLRVVAVENPRQTSAFAYPRSASDVPPLFSRAVALCARDEAMVLISGTASIIEARSVHVDSAAHQTEQTLANIGELLQPDLLGGSGFPASDGGLGALRGCIVYIKRAADVAAVQAVCRRRLPPGIPTVFALADVCRPELLVEIEGIATLTRMEAS